MQHRDIVTPAAMNKVLHQDVCKVGDDGVVLKRPESFRNLKEPWMWLVNDQERRYL